jgi:hypothetical protein
MTRRLSYEEAAAELGVKESWLRDNIRQLPRTASSAGSVYFTDADLARIDRTVPRRARVRGPLAPPGPGAGDGGSPSSPGGDLRPLGGRRARTS